MECKSIQQRQQQQQLYLLKGLNQINSYSWRLIYLSDFIMSNMIITFQSRTFFASILCSFCVIKNSGACDSASGKHINWFNHFTFQRWWNVKGTESKFNLHVSPHQRVVSCLFALITIHLIYLFINVILTVVVIACRHVRTN